MTPKTIKKDIYWIGVNDRTTDLFEGIWPIAQEGVSYNAYFINDKKKALIDLAKSFKADSFFAQIEQIAPLSEIDYIVLNHMEPDHSGIISTLRKINKKAEIWLTSKAQKMLANYYQLLDGVHPVNDGEELNLGEHTLCFYHTPFVHWPETMVTYERTSKILFSCDAFGGYGALRGAIFDDQCGDFDFYMQEALRYYVNIVAKFSKAVLQAIAKLKDLSIEVIAPSHGLIFRQNPSLIVELYRKWASLAEGGQEKAVTLIYGSMYGNTETVMNAVAQGIADKGLDVEIFDAARTHASYILPSLWTKAGVMIGAPTYEGSLFPPLEDILRMALLKHVKNRTWAMFGSYGWSKGALEQLKHLLEPSGWKLTNAFEFAGGASSEVLKQAEEFGRNFAQTLLNEV